MKILALGKYSLLFLAFILCPLIAEGWIIEPTNVPRFVVLNLLVILGLLGLKNLVIPSLSLLIPLICFYGIHLLSISWSFNLADGIYESQKILVGILLIITVLSLLQKEENYLLLLRAFTITSSIVFLIVFYDRFLKDAVTYPKLRLFHLAGHENLMSSVIYLSIALLILHFLKEKNLWFKRFIIFLIIVAIVFIGTLASRTVIFALIISVLAGLIIFLLGKLRQNLKIKGFLLVGLFCLVTCCLILYVGIFRNDQNWVNQVPDSIAERFHLWEMSAQLINENPITGVGAGNWQYNYQKYGIEPIDRALFFQTYFKRPHNDWLWITAETGIIGLFALIFFVVVLSIKSVRQLVIAHQTEVLVVLSVFLGLLIISFFSFPKERPYHIALVAILLAVLLQKIKAYHSIKWPKWIWLPICFALLIFNVFIGFERLKGEYFTKAIWANKFVWTPDQKLTACDQAKSTFYSADPTGTPIEVFKGEALLEQKDYTSLLEVTESAYALSPFDYKVLTNYGYALEINRYTRTAESVLLEAHRINSHYEPAIINLAILFYNRKDFEQSKYWMRKIKDASIRYKETYELIFTGD